MKPEEPSPIALAAHQAGIDKINTLYVRLLEVASTAADTKIKAANIAREMGIHLQELSGHVQINFQFFLGIQSQLPKEFCFESAKKCVMIANQFPKPLKTLEEAKRVEQITFQAAGLLEMPESRQLQYLSPVTPLTLFANTLGAAKERFQKWIEDEPMENWEKDRLETFLSESAWVEDQRDIANRLYRLRD